MYLSSDPFYISCCYQTCFKLSSLLFNFLCSISDNTFPPRHIIYHLPYFHFPFFPSSLLLAVVIFCLIHLYLLLWYFVWLIHIYFRVTLFGSLIFTFVLLCLVNLYLFSYYFVWFCLVLSSACFVLFYHLWVLFPSVFHILGVSRIARLRREAVQTVKTPRTSPLPRPYKRHFLCKAHFLS